MTDRQADAFREASALDWAALDDLAPVADDTPIVTVEEWEARRWDDQRDRPKGAMMARAALAARVADPAAPDDDPTVYDALALGTARTGMPRTLPATLYVPWLVDAARSKGLTVVEVPGWRTRGHGGMRVVEGVVGHHTATPEKATGDYPSLRVVRDGRAGLAGPLCNYGLGRSGTVYVVAAGCAWHAGASAYGGFTDLNDEFLGVEAEDSGDGVWTAAMLDAYPRLVAGALAYMRRPVMRYVSHRGCALPAGRKSDPTGLTDVWMRDQAGAHLAGPTTKPTAPVTPARRGDDMIENVTLTGRGQLHRILPVGKVSGITDAAWVSMAALGAASASVAKASAHVWFQSDTDGIDDKWLTATYDAKKNRSDRPWIAVPDGTTQVVVQYDAPAGATICFETKSR